MTPPRLTAAQQRALDWWRKREATFPAFTRRDPDDLDMATGTWALCLKEAHESSGLAMFHPEPESGK